MQISRIGVVAVAVLNNIKYCYNKAKIKEVIKKKKKEIKAL